MIVGDFFVLRFDYRGAVAGLMLVGLTAQHDDDKILYRAGDQPVCLDIGTSFASTFVENIGLPCIMRRMTHSQSDPRVQWCSRCAAFLCWHRLWSAQHPMGWPSSLPESRVYLGVHWRWITSGLLAGRLNMAPGLSGSDELALSSAIVVSLLLHYRSAKAGAAVVC